MPLSHVTTTRPRKMPIPRPMIRSIALLEAAVRVLGHDQKRGPDCQVRLLEVPGRSQNEANRRCEPRHKGMNRGLPFIDGGRCGHSSCRTEVVIWHNFEILAGCRRNGQLSQGQTWGFHSDRQIGKLDSKPLRTTIAIFSTLVVQRGNRCADQQGSRVRSCSDWSSIAWATAGTRAVAEGWPQWLGAGRDGVWHETGLIDHFPKRGPEDRLADPARRRLQRTGRRRRPRLHHRPSTGQGTQRRKRCGRPARAFPARSACFA